MLSASQNIYASVCVCVCICYSVIRICRPFYISDVVCSFALRWAFLPFEHPSYTYTFIQEYIRRVVLSLFSKIYHIYDYTQNIVQFIYKTNKDLLFGNNFLLNNELTRRKRTQRWFFFYIYYKMCLGFRFGETCPSR